MPARVDQSPLVMLAVNLDQRLAYLPQELHADARVVEKGAAPAVSTLHATEDQCRLGRDAVLAKEREYGMRRIELEGRRHLALRRAAPHERHIAPRAESERQCVEQDRLAGAGFAGQHEQSLAEFEIELVDQDDIADRECR